MEVAVSDPVGVTIVGWVLSVGEGVENVNTNDVVDDSSTGTEVDVGGITKVVLALPTLVGEDVGGV
jgi:hypothetical protein